MYFQEDLLEITIAKEEGMVEKNSTYTDNQFLLPVLTAIYGSY